MRSTMLKLLAGMSLLSVTVVGAVTSGVSTAGASSTSIFGGNPFAVANGGTFSTCLDTWSQTVNFDANTPISASGLLTNWSFYAANTGSIALVIAAPTSSWTSTSTLGRSVPLVYVGPTETVNTLGPTTYSLPGGVWVQSGDVVGFWYDGANDSGDYGIVPAYTSHTSSNYGCALNGTTDGNFYQANENSYGSSPSTTDSVLTVAQDSRTYAISVSGLASGAACKDGGWNTGAFANQGACVSAFATHGYVPIGALGH